VGFKTSLSPLKGRIFGVLTVSTSHVFIRSPARWMLMALPLLGSCDGNLFCFLQLPIKTGTSLHLNGFFELSSNRRDLKLWRVMPCGYDLRFLDGF